MATCAGASQEFDPAGFKLFDGLYEGSRRHGKGTMLLPDGGKLEGTFVDGVLDGTATYWYPGGKSGLKGTWQDGEMAAARLISPGARSPRPLWVWATARRDSSCSTRNDLPGRG